MPPVLRIDEFTDPGCPWAWSAEPFRRRIDWLYGDAIDWRLHMVGLSASPEEYEQKGLTPKKMASGMADIALEHRMPMATHVRPRVAATVPACRAVVAARLGGGERCARGLLRALRLRHFGGDLLDDPDTIMGAAQDAGLGAERLAGWLADPETERELRADMAASREPLAAARVLDERLADWSGGRRYTCPSWEVTRLADDRRAAIPGFQPLAAYEVLLANLAPDLERRPAPMFVDEVLAWAGEPLATEEVAVVMGVSHQAAREELGRIAIETHLGFDGLWSLPRYNRDSMAASSKRASGATASASPSSSAG